MAHSSSKWSSRISENLRIKLNDQQRFLLACVVCGLLCGLLAVVFQLMIHGTFHHLWDFATSHHETWGFVAIMLTAPTLGGLICGLAIKYWVPSALGSGIPQTKEAYYNKGGRISTFTGMWRVILGTVYIGLGNSLGREGPMVHASAAIASRIGRFIFLDTERVRAMIPVGMAAGIGAAFNAPLSAITFVFEELLDNFSTKAIGGMVVAVVIAAAVSRSILGEDPVLNTHLALDYETSAWMLVAIPLGAIAGLMGHFFVGSILTARKFIRSRTWLNSWYTPAAGGLICGMLGCLAFWMTSSAGNAQHGVFSIGYGSLEAAFENQLILSILITLLAFKFVAVVVNYASGGSGGLFSPTLFLGGILGGVVGVLLVKSNNYFDVLTITDESQIIGGCVLLGMGAMFGSVLRCPFTSLIIIFELTGNYSLILPLMGGNMLSWAISRKFRPIALYDALLLGDGVSLKRMPLYRGAQDYRNLPVAAIMTHDVYSVKSWLTAEENLSEIQTGRTKHHAYTVIGEEGRFEGVVSQHELQEVGPETQVLDLVQNQAVIFVHPEASIRDASHLMIQNDIQQLPVLSATDKDRLLGILTLNDIARQQNATQI